MRDSIKYLLLGLLLFLMQSCVLEERIHFEEDLSGTYEISFAVVSDGEEGNEGLSKDFNNNIDSLALALSGIDGVNLNSHEVKSDGFSMSMNFKDVISLNKISAKVSDDKPSGLFVLEDDRLKFSMKQGEPLNKEEEQTDRWLKHRVVITFDKKIKRAKLDGFKKIDKHTLVFDSEKFTDKESISFSIKYKK
jgi:hypothetical protein